jgi:hypothetical protein
LAAVLIAGAADAAEFRDPNAHVVIDIPGDWVVTTDGTLVTAHPNDNTFALEMMPSSDGVKEEAVAERILLEAAGRALKDVKINQHVRRLEGRGFVGFEIYGSGTDRHSDRPSHFFSAVMTDGENPLRGVALVGTGIPAGFKKHQPGIREALVSMRPY